MDAFLRGFTLSVPPDCTAAENAPCKKDALEWLRRALICHVGAAWDSGR